MSDTNTETDLDRLEARNPEHIIFTKDLKLLNVVETGKIFLTKSTEFPLTFFGYKIQLFLISALESWGYDSIYALENTRVLKPEVSNTQLVLFAVKEEDGIDKMKSYYSDFTQITEDIFTKFTKTGVLMYDQCVEIVKSMITFQREYRRFALRFNEYASLRREYLIAHVIESTLLTIAMGESLKLPPHKMIDLGLSCYLHEIGMLRLPKQLLEKTEKLTENEVTQINAHVLYGFKILQSFSSGSISISPNIINAALYHHERMDGSGYLGRTNQNNLGEYTNIVAIACSYQAQIADRPYREAKESFDSLIDLLKSFNKKFDSRLLGLLLKVTSLYPIGSYVLLTNDCIAKVVNIDSFDPKSPTVKIILDDKGNESSSDRNFVVGRGIDIVRAVPDPFKFVANTVVSEEEINSSYDFSSIEEDIPVYKEEVELETEEARRKREEIEAIFNKSKLS